MKRKDTSIPHFVQRIPKDILSVARGSTLSIPVGDKLVSRRITDRANTVKVSLGTRDPSEAKLRQAAIVAYFEGYWQSLKDGPVQLTHKQAVSLSGDIYKAWVGALEDNPGKAETWQRVQDENNRAISGKIRTNPLAIPTSEPQDRNSLELRFGGFVDLILAKRGMVIDPPSRKKLLEQVATAMQMAAKTLERFSSGNYSPDETPARFPEWESSTKVTLTELFVGWKQENNSLSESTYEAYDRTIRYLRSFLKNEDASRIRPEDIIAFKDFRLQQVIPRTGKTVSPRTVKNGDLAALKAIFSWAVKERKLPNNPAKEVTLKVRKKPVLRDTFFTRTEASALLRASRDFEKSAQMKEKTALAIRWVPWICAYTGARVGEIAQLRKSDILQQEGAWVFRISPEAGDVKTNEQRIVPVHSHLVGEGLLNVRAERPDGYLFLNAREGQPIRGLRNAIKNRVREFIRTIVSDPDVQPLHGWRHSFKAYGLEGGMEGRQPFAPGSMPWSSFQGMRWRGRVRGQLKSLFGFNQEDYGRCCHVQDIGDEMFGNFGWDRTLPVSAKPISSSWHSSFKKLSDSFHVILPEIRNQTVVVASGY
ncbi:MAG: tyrosine-type recombinase/integrase [Sneathiella sp.]